MGDFIEAQPFAFAAELEEKTSSWTVLITVVSLDVWMVRFIFSAAGGTIDLLGDGMLSLTLFTLSKA